MRYNRPLSITDTPLSIRCRKGGIQEIGLVSFQIVCRPTSHRVPPKAEAYGCYGHNDLGDKFGTRAPVNDREYRHTYV